MRACLPLLVLLALCVPPAAGQPTDPGAPFSVTHFTAQDYRAQPQNWSLTQDARGLIYAANNGGVLQYDGTRWRRIEVGSGTFARSVAADSQGTVYAGAVGDFGVLRPDSTATLQYVSLAERLPPEQRNFNDVWYTHVIGEDVYFQSRERLFRWDGETLRSWKSPTETFHTSFAVRQTLYVRESNRGLLRLKNDSLQVATGGERFEDMSIYAMLPYGEDGILVGTSKENFLIYDGTSFEPFPTEADALLNEHQLYHGASLLGGEMAFATLGGGAFIIDRAGQLVQVLDSETVLPDGVVNHVLPDRQGGLWMALHNRGIVRAEVSSPLSRFEGFGLEGIVQDLHRQDGTLYAATGAGVYRLTDQATGALTQQRFEKLPEVPATWDLLSQGEVLYAATREGVYRVASGRSQKLTAEKVFTIVDAGTGQSERFYVGMEKGVGLLEQRGGTWNLETLIETETDVRSSVRMAGGDALWVSTLDGAVLRFSLSSTTSGKRRLSAPERFDSTDGLPAGSGSIASFRDKPVFMSQRGLYRMRRTAGAPVFYADTTLARPSTDGDGRESLRAFYEVAPDRAWLFYDDRIEIARRQPDGTYDRTAPPALQFPQGDVVRARIDSQGSAWISSDEELIHYDADRARRLRTAGPLTVPNVLIRQVRDAATGDVVYGGASRYGGAERPDDSIEVPYRQNSLRVAFGLPRYGAETAPLYQYRLKSEGEWSGWQPEAETVLGNLHEGTYTVQVRATSVDGGKTFARASLTLEILPPWYRTVWAYLSYLTAGVLLVTISRHYRGLRRKARRAQKQARRQRRETEREREAREKLQKAHDRLEEANRLKENFLTNTSHEFRTPLASIMGYAEVLHEEELPREQQREFLGVIRRSGDRLLNTVDSLIEIAQLRAGALRLSPQDVEVNQQIEESLAPLRKKAEAKGLDLQFAPAPHPVEARLPSHHLQRVVENLVDNAVKFTREGHVRVTVRDFGSEKGDDVFIEVQDTGVGIADEDAARLFDEFEQASEGISREYEGIGLGLTIAGGLVRLMDGTITVDSRPGEGSTFVVRLPKVPDADASS